MKEEEILGILPLHIRTIIKQAGINWDELQEIRLRIQKPVILKYNNKNLVIYPNRERSQQEKNNYIS